MASKFDYSINIPQPTGFGAGMMQKIGALQNIVEAQDRSALMQQLAPLQVQQAQANLASTQQQMSQSAAAASREEARFGEFTKQQEADRNLAIAISEGKSPAEIAKLMPYASPGFVAKFPEVAQANMASRVGPIIQQGGPKSQEDIQAMKDAMTTSLMLSPERAQMFQRAFSSAPDPIRAGFVQQVMSIGSAGLKGDNQTALKKLEDYATALSGNPQTQELGGMLQEKLKDAKNADKQGLLDKTSWFLDIESLANSVDPQAAKQFRELADSAFKFSESEQKSAERKQKMAGGVDVKELPMGLQKIVNEGADNSATFADLSDKANSIAKSLENLRQRLGGGLGARIKEGAKGIFGTQDDVSAAIQATQALVKEDALARFKKVTSGAISDRETRTALESVPSVYGDPNKLIEYLTALSNGAARASKYEEAKSDWISKFGTLGVAKQEASIGDLNVNKGETFSEFRKRLAADLGKKKFYGADSIDAQNDAERARASREVQKGPPPDFGKPGKMQEINGIKFQIVE
jgi:hypothetical protein